MTPPTPIIDYDTGAPRQKNRAALFSFLFGAMLFVPLFPAVLAIELARRGLDHARQHASGRAGLARWGRTLGLINLFFWLPALSLYGLHAWREAQIERCRDNLRAIVHAVLLYSNDHRGAMPDSFDTLIATGLITPAQLRCPESDTAGPHYHLGGDFINPPPAIRYGDGPRFFALAWESPAAHSQLGISVAFFRAGVGHFHGKEAIQIDADLRAGWNPPPTLDADAARRIQWMATTRAAAAATTSPAR